MGMTRKRWKEWEEEENEKKQCHMTHRLTTPQERMRDGKGETKTHEATLPFLSNLWPCLFPIVMSLPVDKCSMEVRRRWSIYTVENDISPFFWILFCSFEPNLRFASNDDNIRII